VEIEFKGRWFRYLTNVLDPHMLSAADLAALYQQRWRIEDAFNAAKRLLGLAYFYVGSINGVQVQVWATWLLYVVLVDLTDQIADVLDRPFEDISMEMVFKGLYHFVQEKKLGRATDPVSFLAQEAKFYGIIKHRNRPKQPLTSLPDA
ncbi:MAG: transposase, partial [Anaerolineaceae bacterium]|nr:transposase [Anaerolineaceae bacterium]